ncbi:F0F1 ATP synthase subunit gamma [Vulcanibacillus modesticaldus]|uniref:ATP synthase gamma chain n=1 Tax=Vulcanibacillus modesticaldus TaxID=337097 RepID=A0A1D2YVT4_9BACI|nr:ATP synthase F1 subunit gamma [Vulcanibacillus modesticaldus]OEF99830.1 F0F1 ATP synthase subunit gamma [Vulcanibacillus modesticaldus]
MQGTREIKRRIKSVQNTKQITKAMKMVAAAKLRRAQERAEESRPYAEKMKEVITSIAARTENIEHPLLEVREVKKTGYLVITSDRGLAGGYNANLLRKLMQTIKQRHKSQDEYAIFVIGSKGRDFLKRRDYPIIGEIVGLSDNPTFADIKNIANTVVKMYAEGIFDELYLVYNEFISAVLQNPTEKKLLPLVDLESQDQDSFTPIEFEPSAESVLNVLLPRYAETLIYSAVLNAKASEHGARMTAMGNATDNADEMISVLTLTYNRARQASITQEISEIVAGANALS